MRELTDAESRVLTVLLEGSLETEREKFHRADVPRSTFVVARRRLYEEGWLVDRYIPQPESLGIERVTFALAHPFAEGAEALGQAWLKDPGNVLLWKGAQVVLGVFFHRAASASQRLRSEVESKLLASRLTVVSADPRTAVAPVYFDFEGAWCHMVGRTGVKEYPRSIGGYPGRGGHPERLSTSERTALSELLTRPERAAAGDRAGHLVGPGALPRSQLRLVRAGVVQYRVLPQFGVMPPLKGFAPRRLVLIHGDLLPDQRAEMVFARLVGECQVFPFLFASDGIKVLVGALGGSEALPGHIRDALGPRAPVLASLKASMRGIEVVTEDLTQVVHQREHDYSRPEVLGASARPRDPGA